MRNKIKSYVSKIEIKVLILLFVVGICIRTANLTDNINFHYDQGRDAQRIYLMLNEGDIKISGPETDIPGVFNGPIFYYLLAILYGVSGFNINFAALGFIGINLVGAILLYLISKILFQSRWIGIIAVLLWMISYEQAVFSRYISNASLMSVSSMLFFYGLAVYIFQKRSIGFVVSAVGYALAMHFNFYLIYLGAFYPLIFLIYKMKPTLKQILLSSSVFITLVSTFIISELKWNFSTIRSLFGYFLEQKDHADHFLSHISLYLDKMAEMMYYSFFAVPQWLNILVVVSAIILLVVREQRKQELIFLFIWFFSTAPLFIFRSGVLTVPVISTTIFGPTTILVAAMIFYLVTSKNRILKGLGIILLVSSLISNHFLLSREQFRSVNLLSTTPLLLKDEKATIDFTYKKSEENDFSICALTNPLFINSTWSFLYTTYGLREYGDVPFWSGQQQFLNKSLLPYDKERASIRYLILEPLVGIPEEAKMATIYMEDQISIIEAEDTFGDITVQKRKLSPNQEQSPRDTQGLSIEQRESVEKRIANDPRYSCFTEYN